MLDSFLAKRGGFRAWLSGWGGIVTFLFRTFLFRVCGSLRVSGGLCSLFVYSFYGFWFAWCRSIDGWVQPVIEFVAGVAAVVVNDDCLIV